MCSQARWFRVYVEDLSARTINVFDVASDHPDFCKTGVHALCSSLLARVFHLIGFATAPMSAAGAGYYTPILASIRTHLAIRSTSVSVMRDGKRKPLCHSDAS